MDVNELKKRANERNIERFGSLNQRETLSRSKNRYNVAGKSINDLLNIDYDTINKMNREDLREVTNRLVSAGNKRLKRMETSGMGELSPAVQNLKEKGTSRFSTARKNLNELRNEFKKVSDFLKSATSSIRKTITSAGFNKVRKATYRRIGVELGTWTKAEEKNFWKTYRKFEEEMGGESAMKYFGSTMQQQFLAKVYIEKGGKLSNKDIKNLATTSYEEIAKQSVNISKVKSGTLSFTDEVEDAFDM